MKFLAATCLLLSLCLVGCGDTDAPQGDDSMEATLKAAQNTPEAKNEAGRRSGIVKADEGKTAGNTPDANNK